MYPRYQKVDVSTSYHGIGFFGLLTIVLIALKLTGMIDISWWLVFSPIFVAFGLWFVIIAAIVAFTLWLNK